MINFDAENLTELLNIKGLTSKELSIQLEAYHNIELSIESIKKYRQGKAQPSIETIYAIADILETSFDKLLIGGGLIVKQICSDKQSTAKEEIVSETLNKMLLRQEYLARKLENPKVKKLIKLFELMDEHDENFVINQAISTSLYLKNHKKQP